MKRRISMTVKDQRKAAEEFVDAWQRAESGQPPQEPIERLYFEDLPTLLKLLTPKRIEVLKALSKQGPQSVRSLARITGRDYKNVHRDTATLERLGLISRASDGRLTVPWHSIVAEITLAA